MPGGNRELVQVCVDPNLHQRLEEAVATIGLDPGTLIRWAILSRLPDIESCGCVSRPHISVESVRDFSGGEGAKIQAVK